MNSAGDAMGLSIFYLMCSGFVAFIIYKMAMPHEKAKTPHQLGLTWFAGSNCIITTSLLASAMIKADMGAFLAWIIGLAVFGGFCYLIGFIVGKIKFSDKEKIKNSVKEFIPKNNIVTKEPAKSLENELLEIDDKLFKKAFAEITNNMQHEGTWIKSMAIADGDLEKCKATYLRLRTKLLNESLSADEDDDENDEMAEGDMPNIDSKYWAIALSEFENNQMHPAIRKRAYAITWDKESFKKEYVKERAKALFEQDRPKWYE